jgi:hypothetical protein
MAFKLSPWGNQQFFDENGDPATGWKINTYAAGSSTPLTTYTSEAGSSAQSNPIIVNSLGFPTGGEIWLTEGLSYKFVLTDENDVIKKTFDNIEGVNDAAITVSQFQASGVTPTYVSATSFTLAGDQTTDFHVGRRVQLQTTAGTVYGSIATSVFAALTTVTLNMSGSGVLDAGLSSVSLSILRADNSALPTINEARATVAGHATTSDIWSAAGNSIDLTGVIPYTDFPDAPQAGAKRRLYPAAGSSFANNANFSVQGAATFTVATGDWVDIDAITVSTFQITPHKANGSPVTILGTVSQSGGIPTGAIVERGSNANGEYVKFADGTMICTNSNFAIGDRTTAITPLYTTSSLTWTFPAAFIAQPVFQGFPYAGATSAWGFITLGTASSSSLTSAVFRVVGMTSVAGTGSVSLLAVGRWF